MQAHKSTTIKNFSQIRDKTYGFHGPSEAPHHRSYEGPV